MSKIKKEVGELNITVEKPIFLGNEKINGSVKLILNESYSGESVFLILVGKMFTKTYRHQLNEKTLYWDDVNLYEESKSLVCQRFELFNFFKQENVQILEREDTQKSSDQNQNSNSRIIKPGEYKISFNFILPKIIDYSSTACKGAFGISKDVSDHYDFYVKYFLEAFIPTDDTSLVPLKHRLVINMIGNDIIGRKPPDQSLLTNIHQIAISDGCFCFRSGFCVIKTKLEKLQFKSQDAVNVAIDINNTSNNKEITKISYEFKRILHFNKNGYTCSKEFLSGELQLNLPAKKQINKNISCTLPIALALSHNSSLVILKYVIEFQIYSGSVQLDVVQHEFFVEPNITQEKWEDKQEPKFGEPDSEEEDDEDEENQTNKKYFKANSNVNWQRCKSTVDYYYSNIDNFRKIQSITGTQQNPTSP